jgi:HEAT repeat protein
MWQPVGGRWQSVGHAGDGHVSMTRRDLPPNPGRHVSPRDLLALLEREIGEAEAAQACADLLAAADPHDEPEVLLFLGGPAGQSVLDGTGDWKPYWARVWAARGLLYVWTEAAAPVVVRRLGDEHWRVAEMCVKVAAKRDIGAAGPGVAALADHELPRVRAAVVRALGIIGDTEHVHLVREALDDPESDVRRAAARSLERLIQRLDLPADR